MTDSAPTWQTLQKSADRARQGADHARAIEFYSQALAQPDISWEATCAMLMARADSYQLLGNTTGMDTDLTTLAEQAARRGDDAARSAALANLADVLRYTGDFERSLQAAEQALQSAERTGQVGLQIRALCVKSSSLAYRLEWEAASACLNHAEAIASPGDAEQQIYLCRAKQNFEWRQGRITTSRQAAEQGLRLARAAGNRAEEGRFLNGMYISTPDLAARGVYLEQALQAFEAVGARLYQNMILLNSCTWWIQVGLYGHALEAARQALLAGRAMGQDSDILYALQNLSGPLAELGDFSQSAAVAQEGLAIAQKLSDSVMEFGLLTFLATIALYQGEAQSARRWLQQAQESIKELPAQFQANLLSLQAVENRLCGDQIAAVHLAQQALERINPDMFGNSDYPLEQAAWWCYRALAESSTAETLTADISEDQWRALDLGRQALLVPIEHCSDAGLGRGYLHRDRFHRLLVSEWLRHAPTHGVGAEGLAAFAAAVQRPGRLDDVFRRLLGVGVRLNAQRDPARLPGQIVDDVAELIGAERIALLLLAPDGSRRTVKTLLPIPPFPGMSGKVEPQPDEAAFLAEIEPCIEEASLTRQGFVRRINPDGSLAEQRSLLVAPLLHQNRLVGMIYCDLTGCFGRLEREDLDLLTVLANQSAVAVENADWSATLENKVAERTAELEKSTDDLQQRNGELTIINSIQQGLAAELDFQAIVNLVGDKLSEVLHTGNLGIRWIDESANMVHYLYEREHGLPLEMPSTVLRRGSAWEQWLKTHQPTVVNTLAEMMALGISAVPGTDQCISMVDMPIIYSDRLIGIIHDENFDKEYAYGESELRLLTTIAGSLGSALENARLFAETQRLFKAEQERVAELAILNSVGEGMAKTMDVKSVARIVGDKVRDIFDAPVVSISLLDPHTNLVHNQYEYDHGEGGYIDYIEPFKLGTGLTSKVISLRQPLLLGTAAEQTANGAFTPREMVEHSSGVIAQSWLGVPILTGDRVLGIVVLADYRVNAFNENHVRLLQTLSANMGVAIENARLFQAEQERVGELQIINSIQQGLAAELDFQAIVNLVGDKLSEVLHTGNLGIRWIDENTKKVHFLYEREHGLPVEMPSIVLKPGGFWDQMMKTRQPIIYNTVAEMIASGVSLVPGTDQSKSTVDVPIINSDRFIGAIHDENFDKEYAYGEAELRLLTTIAGSLGSALENARLFAETQRLFKAEQERVGELQIINSIQQGLAAELDFQAIVDLVGDKLREVFHTQELGITWYDEKTGLLQTLYDYEHGVRLELIPPRPLTLNGPFARELKTRQPVVFNTTEEGDALAPTTPGTDISKSGVFIPVISSDRVIGSIRVENFEREYAYGQAELRLLTTVAASLGSALENARLFAETQRLFKAEQERVAELAILNSVGEGMAKTMDVKTVARIVGDKVRDIFDAPIVSISLLDPHTNLVHNQYEYDRGEGGYVDYIEPFKLGTGLTSKVISLRQPLLLGTAAEQTANGAFIPREMLEHSSGVTAQSWLGVPIISGDRVMGIVVLADYRVNAFNENHVRLLQTLSANMGVAIENARLFQAEQERVAELQIINSIQQGLAAELDFQAIVDLVGDKLREVFHTQELGINWYDEKTGLIQSLYEYEHGERMEPMAPHPPSPSGPFARQLKTHLPVVFNTTEEGDALGPNIPGTDASKSGAFIPVISSDRVLGSIRVENYEREYAFGETELRVLTTVAASLGTALENARLFAETQRLLEESQRRMDQLTMLSEVGRTLSSTLQVNELLQLIYEQIQRVMYAENMYIALYQSSTDEVEFVFSRNVDEVRPGERGSAKEGIIGYILRSRQPVFIRGDFEKIERELDIKLVGIPAASWLGVPLLLGERALGVIAVQHYTDPNAYDDTHLMLLQAIAGQAAVALENARLYVDADWRAGQMATLAEAGREITASHDLPAIMQKITQRAHEVCRARSTILRLADADGQAFHTSVALGEYADQFMSDVIKPGSGITGSIIVSGLPEIIQDPRIDPRMTHVPGTPEEEEHPETMMIAPLVVRGETVGVLTLYRWMSDGYFTSVDLNFLSGLARQTAIAIENLRLLEETQEAQRRMADIINFLPDAALVIDRDGRVIAWNRAMEEMTGKKAADMLGKGDYEYAEPFYGDRRPILIDLVLLPDEKVETNYAQIRREGSVLTGETFVPMLNGHPAYLYANASALRNARGEIVGAIETIRDISERKRAEQELHLAKAEAEEARREAEAATQAKSSFLATMSHEIRTPMNAIIGMSGLLLNTPLDDQQREFADIIRVSGDSLLTIINDILDFSKIEAGKLDLEFIAFDLRESLESTIDLLATRAAEKKLDLAVEISPGVPAAIISDVTRLRQILLNLLNNAVKFTEHGEVVLSVSCAGSESASDSGEVTLHFAVRDTGIGIPADRLDRLFQSFSQVDASTSRKYGGTGLGLAISKRLSEMMGGKMWVESTAGVGSTFHFTIRAAPATLSAPAGAQFNQPQPNLAGRRLLVVDDNATNRRIITLQTRDWGMLARETGSPAEALEWLRSGDPFDIAILDFHMPEMDGLALGRAMRQVRDAASLPLVLLSSLGGRETTQQAADKFAWAARLTKPVKQSQLFNILATIFGQAEDHARPQTASAAAKAALEINPLFAQRCPLRILLVEDMPFNQKLAVHLLKQMGYTTDLASNGLEAIQSVERQEYDVVLMDVQMPEMDGLEATRRICARWPVGQRPRIVAMTANAMQGDLEICLAAGMDDYVAKPIRVQELAAALERASKR